MKMKPIINQWREYVKETNVARAGMDREVQIAAAMNEFFAANNLQFSAAAAGGAGAGSATSAGSVTSGEARRK